MKIGIIGDGIIGGACKYGFQKLGHEVIVHDIKYGTELESVLDTEIVYVCVPTPSNADGSCNTTIVESIIDDLIDNTFMGIIAIKSTVKPTTTQSLIDRYKNDRICFVPEFLRERSASSDFIEKHDLLAVGTENSVVYNRIVECHGNYPKNVVQLKPTEAELLKYYSNNYNALKVVFANQMYEICKATNADYSAVKNAFVKRGTTIDMYLDVNENFRSYSGPCLVKDVLGLDSLVKDLKLDLKLFETMNSENNKFKKTVFDGMRPQ